MNDFEKEIVKRNPKYCQPERIESVADIIFSRNISLWDKISGIGMGLGYGAFILWCLYELYMFMKPYFGCSITHGCS